MKLRSSNHSDLAPLIDSILAKMNNMSPRLKSPLRLGQVEEERVPLAYRLDEFHVFDCVKYPIFQAQSRVGDVRIRTYFWAELQAEVIVELSGAETLEGKIPPSRIVLDTNNSEPQYHGRKMFRWRPTLASGVFPADIGNDFYQPKTL